MAQIKRRKTKVIAYTCKGDVMLGSFPALNGVDACYLQQQHTKIDIATDSVRPYSLRQHRSLFSFDSHSR